MNAYISAQDTYKSVSQTVKTPKRVEYELFAKVTHQLKLAATQKKSSFPKFVEALHQNRKLWRILASDVAQTGNLLDADVKGQILYLAEFTHAYTSRVMSEQITVRPLLDINAAVLRGLKDN